jgi:acyl carrier protein
MAAATPGLEDGMRALVARFARTPGGEITAAYRLGPANGWGSLAALQLLAAVEDEYGLSLDLAAYLRIATVGELVEHVRGRLAGARP